MPGSGVSTWLGLLYTGLALASAPSPTRAPSIAEGERTAAAAAAAAAAAPPPEVAANGTAESRTPEPVPAPAPAPVADVADVLVRADADGDERLSEHELRSYLRGAWGAQQARWRASYRAAHAEQWGRAFRGRDGDGDGRLSFLEATGIDGGSAGDVGGGGGGRGGSGRGKEEAAAAATAAAVALIVPADTKPQSKGADDAAKPPSRRRSGEDDERRWRARQHTRKLQRRFRLADADGDGALTAEEFGVFQQPRLSNATARLDGSGGSGGGGGGEGDEGDEGAGTAGGERRRMEDATSGAPGGAARDDSAAASTGSGEGAGGAAAAGAVGSGSRSGSGRQGAQLQQLQPQQLQSPSMSTAVLGSAKLLCDDFLDELDGDEDGTVSRQEWGAFQAAHSHTHSSGAADLPAGAASGAATTAAAAAAAAAADLAQFAALDVDGNGHLTALELFPHVCAANPLQMEQEAAQLVQQADGNGNGNLEFAELRTISEELVGHFVHDEL